MLLSHARVALLLTLVASAASLTTAAPGRLGTHILLEVLDAPFSALNSSAVVRGALQAAVDAAELTVVGEHVHTFPVMGVSAVLVISESHLSVHTWPEIGSAAVDFFTCGAATPLPCGPHETITFGGEAAGWRCADGRPAGGGGVLWSAVLALLAALDARGATVSWMDRGVPVPALAAARTEPGQRAAEGAYGGWLGGLEAAGHRPEL